MKNKSSNVTPSAIDINQKNTTKAGLTPRELIHYHMNNPDEPIKDEDIENLVLITQNSSINTNPSGIDYAGRMLETNEIKQIKDHTITTPFDILGE